MKVSDRKKLAAALDEVGGSKMFIASPEFDDLAARTSLSRASIRGTLTPILKRWGSPTQAIDHVKGFRIDKDALLTALADPKVASFVARLNQLLVGNQVYKVRIQNGNIVFDFDPPREGDLENYDGLQLWATPRSLQLIGLSRREEEEWYTRRDSNPG